MANLKADLDSYLASKPGSATAPTLASNILGSLRLPTLHKGGFRSAGSSKAGGGDDEVLLLGQGEDGGGRDQHQDPNKSGCCCWPSPAALSRRQRLTGFTVCLALALVCFSLAMAFLPLIVLKARKFALLFSLGSLSVLTGLAFLLGVGPVGLVKHLATATSPAASGSYLASLGFTLYFAMGLQSTLLTTVAACVQLLALLCFVVSSVPGGQTGLRFLARHSTSLCGWPFGGGGGGSSSRLSGIV